MVFISLIFVLVFGEAFDVDMHLESSEGTWTVILFYAIIYDVVTLLIRASRIFK